MGLFVRGLKSVNWAVWDNKWIVALRRKGEDSRCFLLLRDEEDEGGP